MNHKKKKARLIYIIDKEFQLTFLLHNSVILIFGVILTLGVLYWINQSKYEGGAVFKLRQDPVKMYQKGFEDKNGVEIEKYVEKDIYLPDYDHKLDRFSIQLGGVLIVSALFFVMQAVFLVFNSHRMAGPIFNIKRTIRKIVNGESQDNIKLRKSDEFQDLAAIINEMIEKKASEKEKS